MLSDKEIEEHIEYVKLICFKYHFSGCDESSIFSAGLKGLLEAAEKHNPFLGVKFKTYASQIIKGRIVDYLRGISHRGDAKHKIFSNGSHVEHVSLDYKFEEDGEPLANRVEDHTAKLPGSEIQEKELKDIVAEIFYSTPLSEQEETVISLYYLEDYIEDDIGKILGVTGSRINQIRKKALEKLRIYGLKIISEKL